MGRTYEALMRVKKEEKKDYLQPVEQTTDALLPVPIDHATVVQAPEWYKELKAQLLLSNDNRDSKAILFTGAHSKAGCSHVSVEFALCLANAYRHRVLLVDVNVRNPKLQKYFNSGNARILDELIQRNDLPIDIKNNDKENLFVITCNTSSDYKRIIDFFSSEQFKKLVDHMKSSFDYVIFDSPPVNTYSETKLLSSKVDGVVLVAHSGKTRTRIVSKAKREIETAGGYLFGVILNKRRYYIPKWLYNRM